MAERGGARGREGGRAVIGPRRGGEGLGRALAPRGDPAGFWRKRPICLAEAGNLDTTDLAIVRQLAHPATFQWDVRVSYADVGRALGIDEETVRARVKKLQDAGVLTGWDVMPNPRVLGRDAGRVELPCVDEAAKRRTMDALPAMDGIWLVFDNYGTSIGLVAFWEAPSVPRNLKLLEALGGRPPMWMPMTIPPAAVELERIDWRVVRALRRNPRGSFEALAQDAGLSERTVRRRLTRLTDGRALLIVPRVDQSKVDGLVMGMLVVEHKDPKTRGDVDAFLRTLPGTVFAWFEGPVSRVSLGRRNIADLDALRREVGAMPGVARVFVEIIIRRFTVDAWLDDLVERRASEPARAAPKRSPRRGS